MINTALQREDLRKRDLSFTSLYIVSSQQSRF